MRRLLLELKIAGINFPLVTAALSLALVLFAALAGELLDFAPIAFEVVFPPVRRHRRGGVVPLPQRCRL